VVLEAELRLPSYAWTEKFFLLEKKKKIFFVVKDVCRGGRAVHWLHPPGQSI
jgi:hypothetical protein